MAKLPKDAERLVDPIYTFIARGWNSETPDTFTAAADNIAAEIAQQQDDPEAIAILKAAETYLRHRGARMHAELQAAFGKSLTTNKTEA